MNVNSPTLQRPIGPSVSTEQAGPVRNVRSTGRVDPVDQARKKFLDDGETEYLGGTLTAGGHQLTKAAVKPDKPGAPCVSVSTFAVDGVQSKDMMVIKRVPATAEGPNFIVYMPEDEVTSFHEFNTVGELTEWVKAVANDPAELNRFARHFSHSEAPKQEERVRTRLSQFGSEKDSSVVVGSFGRERGDIFERLNKDVTVPPVEVNGLSNVKLHELHPDGRATYIGTREDGKAVIFDYDAYGNFRGGSQDGYYFVRNGLNNKDPLGEPITFAEFTEQKVAAQAYSKTGPNDLSDFWDYLVKQLRNPGDGLGTALQQFGVPDDVAASIEEVLKNPVKGTLLELNRDNRLGKVFGVSQEVMDAHLEKLGDEAQSNIPQYGKWRDRLNTVADVIERKVGTPEESTPEVKA
ncbi:dermonecrotic toxin domain-containing protein [Pseudomonas salmasensis]|uniref:dermonecrotic toxin domain-containing protein n=1 Tax=Pseudomonas salmasensis TaxID=2745514 RepID=UPI001648DE82|nr:DUF6543 domain-containing protein [Pseudomonas salmasensis]QXH78618.1 hypothetical protein HU731_001980 [Pseudomonas salmasensis]